MKRALGDNDIYKFNVGKFGELSVSARHYMDLLGEADKAYTYYVKRWKDITEKALRVKTVKLGYPCVKV